MKSPACSAILVCLLACSAEAATLTVANHHDSGPGSLRHAIANAAAGDTIDFAVTGTITLTSGELTISRNLTIAGPGADTLTVARSSASGTPEFRIFTISNGTATGPTVTLSGLTLSNGRVSGSSPANQGGGIYNDRATVTVQNSTFSDNSAASGGGIYNRGNLTVQNSTLRQNSASTVGGGICNDGNLTIQNSTASQNSAASGSGIYNGKLPVLCGITLAQWAFPAGFTTSSPAPSTVVPGAIASAQPGDGVTSTDFAKGNGPNSWGSLGNIASGTTLVPAHEDYLEFAVAAATSAIELVFDAARNTAINSPRGLAVYAGTSSLARDGVPGNGAATDPGNLVFINANTLETTFTSYGPIPLPNGTTHVRIYFFNAGTASAGSDAYVDNVTFTGCPLAVATVQSCTVSGNSATEGGGILNGSGGTAWVGSSLIALNTASIGADVSGSFNSTGYNLVGRRDGSTGFTTDSTDQTGTVASPLNPLLVPSGLQDNGGPTHTIALQPGSRAIDAGVAIAGLTTDQRGIPRPQGSAPDVGAFELVPSQAAVPIMAPLGGTYENSVEVTITSTSEGSTVRYTLDGSEPSETDGTVYNGPFTLTSTATVKAIAYGRGWLRSPIASGSYSVQPPLGYWRYIHSLAADGSQDLLTPAGDGVANLLKYAFNMAPNAGDLNRPNVAVLPENGTAGLPRFWRDANGRLVMEFVRRKSAANPGSAYVVETGSTVAGLEPLSLANAQITSIDAGWERVTVTDSIATSARFGRVRVQTAP